MILRTHVVIEHNKQGNITSLKSPYDGDKKINKPIWKNFVNNLSNHYNNTNLAEYKNNIK